MFGNRARATNYLEPDSPRFEGPRSPSLPAPRLKEPGTFFVTAFNIHFGYEPEKAIATLSFDGMSEADVVLLQESDDRSAQLIASGLGANYVYYPANTHPTSGKLFGVAVVSRWPIRQTRKILLPDNSYFDGGRKVAMTAEVLIDGVPVEVVSVHLQSGMLRWSYRKQVKSLVRCVLSDSCEGDAKGPRRTRPIVFGGDFNTWEGGLERILKAQMAEEKLKRVDGIEDTFNKLTSGRGLSTFDYFFVSPDLYLKPGLVGLSRDGSDHFPIMAAFRLPERARP